MSAPAASITLLSRWQPHQEVRPAPTGCYACMARLQCYDLVRNTYTTENCRALFSPGEPFSVVLPMEHRDLRPTAEPADWPHALAWYGVPCELIWIRIGLPVLGSAAPRPFKVLALLPTRDVDDAPPLLRLGAEFLQANQASVHLTSSPCEGRLVIPYA